MIAWCRSALTLGAEPTLAAAGASLAAAFLEAGMATGDSVVLRRLLGLLAAPLATWDSDERQVPFRRAARCWEEGCRSYKLPCRILHNGDRWMSEAVRSARSAGHACAMLWSTCAGSIRTARAEKRQVKGKLARGAGGCAGGVCGVGGRVRSRVVTGSSRAVCSIRGSAAARARQRHHPRMSGTSRPVR